METKICKRCGKEKPLEEFHKWSKSKDGRRTKCKKCRNEENKKYRDKRQNKTYIKIESKECIMCGKVKNVSEFNKRSDSPDGYRNDCTECKNKRDRENYKKNPEAIKQKVRDWRKKNPDRKKVLEQKRLARKHSLPNDLTNEEWLGVLEYWNNKCALSGSNENVTLEHFLPLSICYGGTILENVYPMELHLNCSKSNKNPFEWIKTQPLEYQHNFYTKLIPYLAKINGMNNKEFKEYTYWCFEHPRTLDEIPNQSQQTS